MFRATMPFAVAAALAAASLPALAQQSAPQPRIVVSGEGEAALRPDLALITLAVMREAPTAREAMTANNDAMAAVIAALKEAGVADRDLQTAGLQINPRYDYPRNQDGSQTAVLAAYQVTNTLSVRVRDIAKVGEILDQAVTLGVNQGGGISFTNDDPSAAIEEARRKAVADAIAKARTLAQAAGVDLGKVVEISEQSFAPPPMPFLSKIADARESVPVEAGENAYRVQVGVTFEIAQ
jgi:uncharacterized protein YggE